MFYGVPKSSPFIEEINREYGSFSLFIGNFLSFPTLWSNVFLHTDRCGSLMSDCVLTGTINTINNRRNASYNTTAKAFQPRDPANELNYGSFICHSSFFSLATFWLFSNCAVKNFSIVAVLRINSFGLSYTFNKFIEAQNYVASVSFI